MVQHDPSENDQASPHIQTAVAPPAMNWNKASGRGLRTSLRPSQSAVIRHIPSQTSHLQTIGHDEHKAISTTSPTSNLDSEEATLSNEETPDSIAMVESASAEKLIDQRDHELRELDQGQGRLGIPTLAPAAENLKDTNEIDPSAVEMIQVIDMTSDGQKEQSVQFSLQRGRPATPDGSHTITEQGTRISPDDYAVAKTHSTPSTGYSHRRISALDGNDDETHNTIEPSLNGESKKIVESPLMATADKSPMTEQETLKSPTGSLRGSANNVSHVERDETGTEEGEISDDGVVESDTSAERVASARIGYQDSSADETFPNGVKHHNVKEVIEIESDDDAMITNYADAQQEIKNHDSTDSKKQIEPISLDTTANSADLGQRKTDLKSTEPQTLADLTTEQLEVQVRYFYVTRDPTTIPETDPVRCITCAGIGHLDHSCPAQTCSHCKSQGVHFSKDCPKTIRCSRCRGFHSTERCKLKLKPRNLVLTCDLCHEKGHVEADCELIWRSSGPLWKKPLPPLSIVRTCFNCGDSGHLGNDCQLRRPGKQMGSSMWSMRGLPSPLTPLTGADNHAPAPVIAKNKQKLPNIKAKGVAAQLSKPVGSVQPPGPSLSINSSQSVRPTFRNVKGKPTPANIQIKGLANRASLDSPAYSAAPVSGRYPDRRDSHDSYYRNGYSTPTSGYPKSDQFHSNEAYNDHPHDRYVDQQRRSHPGSRPRSRSRSPRRWDSPPRQSNYGGMSRDRWDRDDHSQAGQPGNRGRQSWQYGSR